MNYPVSLYAATKKANELMAHTYSHLYGLPATGLRFFTVYGLWGRPDMAPMLFAKAILAGEPIRVFNQGQMRRDFTYIDDIVEVVLRCLDKPATADPSFDPLHPNPATAAAPHRLFNIGNAQPVELLRFIEMLEQALGREAIKTFEPMQPGDVKATAADTSALEAWVGFRPHTPLELGLERFAAWVKDSRSRSPGGWHAARPSHHGRCRPGTFGCASPAVGPPSRRRPPCRRHHRDGVPRSDRAQPGRWQLRRPGLPPAPNALGRCRG